VSLQLIGVFDADWLEPVAETLRRLGSTRVWAVHGEDRIGGGRQGLDELTLAGPSQVVALEDGRLYRFTVTPEMVGLQPAPIAAIAGGDAAYNAAALEALLRGAQGAYRDTVLLNAAAALRVARGGNMFPPGSDARFLREAIAEAARVLDDGSAWSVLETLRADHSKAGLPKAAHLTAGQLQDGKEQV
jgi:anthranilate phosphoribosyltransferase